MMLKKITMLLMLLTLLFALGGCGNGTAASGSSVSPTISSNESDVLPNSSSVSEPNTESGTQAQENISPASASASSNGAGTASQENAPPASPSAPSGEAGTSQENDTPPAEDSSPAESGGSEGAVLIAYFSWSGNTQRLAGMIQEQTGGDLFRIEMETPYTDNESALSGLALQEQRNDTRPPLSTHVEEMDNYAVVFIGYPNWWNDAPMPVFTFLEEYDFSGKTVIPFTTYGDGGFGRSVNSIKESLRGVTIADGLAIQEHTLEDAPAKVTQWLQSLGLTR